MAMHAVKRTASLLVMRREVVMTSVTKTHVINYTSSEHNHTYLTAHKR